MRFRLDGEGEFRVPNAPHLKPKAAPAPGVLGHEQRVEFLKLLHEGLGSTMACAQLGIGINDLKRAMSVSAGFRRAISQIEQVRAERLYRVLYEAALNGDTEAAQFLLERHDREAERRDARRNAS